MSAVLVTGSFTAMAGDKATAQVEQRQGLYVFVLSKPAGNYETLGSVSGRSINFVGKPEGMLDDLLKKVRQDYPQADGVIFSSINMDAAIAIRLKE